MTFFALRAPFAATRAIPVWLSPTAYASASQSLR